ncbi:hypothetical protein JKY72_06625 [Candidatus Gracilibacteria bacterium]|nr:hypothetical protein [Candidatus Gracilibacteria bacterium]
MVNKPNSELLLGEVADFKSRVAGDPDLRERMDAIDAAADSIMLWHEPLLLKPFYDRSEDSELIDPNVDYNAFIHEFGLEKTAQMPESVDDLLNVTVDPLNLGAGVFVKIKVLLSGDGNFIHSLRALEAVEEEMRSVLSCLPSELGRQKVEEEVFSVRKMFAKLFAWRSDFKRLPAASSIVQDVFSVRIAVTKDLSAVFEAISGDPSFEDRALLQSLYLSMKKVSSLLEAFRVILAFDISQLDLDDSKVKTLLPLVKREGLKNVLEAGSVDGRWVKSFFSIFPLIAEKYCKDLKGVSAIKWSRAKGMHTISPGSCTRVYQLNGDGYKFSFTEVSSNRVLGRVCGRKLKFYSNSGNRNLSLGLDDLPRAGVGVGSSGAVLHHDDGVKFFYCSEGEIECLSCFEGVVDEVKVKGWDRAKPSIYVKIKDSYYLVVEADVKKELF